MMRVGVSLLSAHAVDDVREGARRMVERARAAETAGLDSLFVGDHHAVPIPYYQNTAILGRLLAEWGDRPVGALYLLPLWHPVLVAEQVGTLASLAEGPFVMQCAIGGGPAGSTYEAQFAAMGVPVRERPRRFEAALDVIRRLLAGEEVTAEEPVPIEAARVNPLPPEPVEVWIGGSAPPAIERAARLGDAWYAGPELTSETAREQIGTYRVACERFERTPTRIPLRRDVFVGEDEDEVERLAHPVIEGGYRGFDPSAPIAGTVEQVAAALRPFAEMGYTDVVTRQLVDDHGAAVASIGRLAEVRRLVADA